LWQVAYYECRIVERGASGSISVGLAPKDYADFQHPGSAAGAYALQGSDGTAVSQPSPRPFGKAFNNGDVVGCGESLSVSGNQQPCA
jgi:hypothetical protein